MRFPFSRKNTYIAFCESKALVKRIQHFTEQRTTFVLGEMLDSFHHLVYCARYCSTLFDGNKNGGRAIEHFFCLRFSFNAKFSNSMLCSSVSMGHSAGAHETLEMLSGM